MTKTIGPLISVDKLRKSFTLHDQSGITLSVIDDLSFSVRAGECVALNGPSGAGKSTTLRLIYGNYCLQGGSIIVAERGNPASMVDLAQATPRDILRLRASTIGYVSQFLRAMPRVSALDIVAEPLLSFDYSLEDARTAAADLLARLGVRESLWRLAPATFSGGEKQRVNIAHSLISQYPVLLLDEPTSALDRRSCDVVVELIREAKVRGAAIVAVFHDDAEREKVADQVIEFKTLEYAQ
jgi:alpha-D-ribose 1-methylphosphonate 5-triphosphate synthase subunit PhnL